LNKCLAYPIDNF